jgi:hypothetical protein
MAPPSPAIPARTPGSSDVRSTNAQPIRPPHRPPMRMDANASTRAVVEGRALGAYPPSEGGSPGAGTQPLYGLDRIGVWGTRATLGRCGIGW